MHSDHAEVKKSVRSYITVFVLLMVFTIITVVAASFHLVVPLAITIALIIAAIKGSMVAGVFMHLRHERPAIYGALLLTVVFFAVLPFICCSSRCRSCSLRSLPLGRPASTGSTIGLATRLLESPRWRPPERSHFMRPRSSGRRSISDAMRTLLVIIFTVAAPRAALACPVCFGQSDSPMAWGANMGIFVMLAVTSGVLAGFATFFIYLMRRARLVNHDVTVTRGSNPQEGSARC
jgi:caa(3)-type oxidase subunit IV